MKRSKHKHENAMKKNYKGSFDELKKFVGVNQENYKKDLELLYKGMHRLENFVKRLKQNV